MATPDFYLLSLHDALPIFFIFVAPMIGLVAGVLATTACSWLVRKQPPRKVDSLFRRLQLLSASAFSFSHGTNDAQKRDRKSTRLNSSHVENSYAVFCLKKK